MASSPVIIQVATPGPAGPAGPGGPTGPPGYAPRYYVQPGAPASGVGLAGDMYINSTTSDVWGPKINNTTWPATPACNIRGIAGYSPLYIVAAGVPSGATGNIGDMYINSTTADLYGPKSGSGWGGIVANLKGPAGPPGYAPQYYVQPGAPASGVGLAGDMYINSTTSDVWGPKINNTTWPATPACNIRGIAGYSPLYIVAAGVPSGATGNIGDMYINSTTADLYGPKSGSGWGGVVANLKGPAGPPGTQGPPGVAYTPRGAWSAATTYAQGDEATDVSILYISLQAGNLNHAPAANAAWWQPVAAAGAQTPWLGNINGATFDLGNVGKVGIGTASPDSRLTATDNPIALPAPPAGTILHLGAADGASGRITLDAFGGIPNWTLRSAGGTAAAPTASIAGAILGNIVVFGRGATGYSIGARAAIGVIAAENWTDSAQGTIMTFSTTLLGAAGSGERMRIDGLGNVGIGTPSPSGPLDVMGIAANGRLNVTFLNNGATGLNSRMRLRLGSWSGFNTTDLYPYMEAINELADGSQVGLAFGTYKIGSGLVAERMRIDGTGNVGIGTTAPLAPLHVAAAADGYLARINGPTAGFFIYSVGADYQIGTSGAGALQFDTAVTERMRITAAGQVGIGTPSPADKLTLVPVIYSANQNGGIRLQTLGNEWYYRMAIKSDGGGAPRLTFDAGALEIVAITGDGMGIGKVPATGRALDVTGSIWCTGSYRASSKYNVFGIPGGPATALAATDANVCLYDNGSGNWAGIGSDSGGVMWFRTGLAGTGDARMVIDTLGRVGIAKVSPAYTLDVTGDVNCTGVHRVNGLPLTIDASQVASGVLATARLGAGAANSSVYLRGDGTWAALTIDASQVASGVLATARLGTGTANSSVYLRGDGTWAAAAGGGSGPTTQNVATGVAAVGTIYRNNSGKTMYVSVALFVATGTTSSAKVDATTNPSTVVAGIVAPSTVGLSATMTFVVLPLYYYVIVGGTLNSWVEWF